MQYSIQYRPRTWEEIYGQDMIVKSLQKRSITNNFPNATLIAGPFGTGKTTIANLMAMSIQCNHKDEKGNPCLQCESCKSILNETWDRDTEMLDGSQVGQKDSIVEFTSRLKVHPMYDKKRVIIIEESDQLSNAAALALLKVLENPNKWTHFILLSMDNKVPPSIKSRCQTFNLKSINIYDTMKALKAIMEKTNTWNDNSIPNSFKTEGLGIIAKAAQGSLRTAVQYLEEALISEMYDLDTLTKTYEILDEDSAYKIIKGLLDKSKDPTLWKSIYDSNAEKLYNYMSTIVSESLIYKETQFAYNDKFEQSLATLSKSENLSSLNNALANNIFSRPYITISNLLVALAEYMKSSTNNIEEKSIVIGTKVIPSFLENTKPSIPTRKIPSNNYSDEDIKF